MNSTGKSKALFLDRDGTINVERNYVSKIKDFKFQPGIFELIKGYQQEGFLIFVVTNQSGIARGYYSEQDFQVLNNWMLEQFRNKGIKVSEVYYCPHHPEITGICSCRKPLPGMILKAIKDYNISPKDSVLIGDKKRDILAGQNAGIGKNLYIQEIVKTGKF